MIKPDQHDMEPETFHSWSELFVSNMMSIDRKWGLILTTLQRKDAASKKEDISCIQDELKMPLEIKSVVQKVDNLHLARENSSVFVILT